MTGSDEMAGMPGAAVTQFEVSYPELGVNAADATTVAQRAIAMARIAIGMAVQEVSAR